VTGEDAQGIEVCLRKFDPKAEGTAGESPGARPHLGSVVLLMSAVVSRGKGGGSQSSKGKGGKEGGADAGPVSGVCFVGQDLTGQREAESNFTKVQGDYSAIVHGPNSLIPPIFAVRWCALALLSHLLPLPQGPVSTPLRTSGLTCRPL